MNVITLEYDGTEKDLAGWGYSAPILRLRSRAASTFSLIIPGGDPAAAPPIPFEAQIKIYMDRTGSGTSWSGGTLIFQGRRTDINASAQPQARNVKMVFSDAWYDLEHIVYQMQWYKQHPGTDITTVAAYYSRIYLWYDISTGGLLSSDDQLDDIISFAATECGAAIQSGTIDPIQNYPIYATKAVTCADAIITVLRGMPDTVTFFDYTTTPPSLNIRQRQNLTPVTLPYATTDTDGARYHKSSSVRPRPDLQVPSVVLQYQITNTIDGQAITDLVADSYGADDTGFSLRDLVAPLDLRGYKETYVTGRITAKAIDPSTTAFWTAHKPDLADDSITGLTVVTHSLETDGGDDIDTDTYPNELIEPGHFAPWMKSGSTQIICAESVAYATVSYQRKNAAGFVDSTIISHPVSCRVKLTNSAVGTINYTTQQSAEQGEPQPLYLAYAIWCSINNVVPVITDGVYAPPEDVPAITSPENLQWEGDHVMVENNVSAIITPGNTLNLTADPATGNAPWVAINAQIYDVEIDFFYGRTTVQFGPHKYLSAQQFLELVMMFRIRLVLDNPQTLKTGVDSSNTGPSLTTDSKLQNTNSSDNPPKSLDTVSVAIDGGTAIVQKDANTNGGQLRIAQVDSDSNTLSASVDIRCAINDVNSDLVELSPSDSLPVIALRLIKCCDADGNPATMYVLGSFPVTDS